MRFDFDCTKLLLACVFRRIVSAEAEPLIKDGQKLAFLGDSITQAGWGNPQGYVRLVVAGLATNGIKVSAVPAGIGGHKSNQMLERAAGCIG